MRKYTKRFSVLLLVTAVMVVSFQNSYAQRQKHPPRSLFSDVKATQVGDILTVLVQENANALNRSSTNTNKNNTLEMKSEGGTGLMKFLPSLGIKQETKNQFGGSGEVSSSESFNSTLSARIVQVLEDGNFLIKASREVETNGEKQVTIVQGTVRPYDITANNTIYSYQIANVSIYHQGKGVVNDGHRPGLFTRLINWLF